VDNEFFPLTVGATLVLEDGSGALRLEVVVPDETEDVAGVTTRVMEEWEYEDGELIEISRNFLAQAPDGTVCYFGEDVDIYENGVLISHGGAWRAGQDGSLPGIMMPGSPEAGQVFYQEYAPGVAQDMGSVVALGETITVKAGSFSHTLTTEEWSPDELSYEDRKIYVSGIGIAVDAEARLISY
jgi:hypothetical protein